MREHDEPDVQAGLHQPIHGREQRERPLRFAELTVNSEIGPVSRKIAPYEIPKFRIDLSQSPQRPNIEFRSLGCEYVLRHREAAGGRNAIRSDPASDCAFRDRAGRNHELCGAQHMVVEQLELRMLPQTPRIAASHPDHMRHAGHLRGKITGHPIGLQIVGEDDVERLFHMRARRNRRELRNERAVHRNMRLRAIDRVGPVHRHGTGTVHRPAAVPVLRPHVHPVWCDRFFGVGDDMDIMAVLGQTMRAPISLCADTALDWRKLSDDADSHDGASISPHCARSRMSSFSSGGTPSVAGSVQSPMAASMSKTTGATWNTLACSAPRGKLIASGVSRWVAAVPPETSSKIGRIS